MPLTPQDVEQIAIATAEKLKNGHACRFNDDEAAVVHGFRRALKEHKAGEREIFVVIQLGKNLSDFFDRAGKAILWTLIIAAVLLFAFGVIPLPWRLGK